MSSNLARGKYKKEHMYACIGNQMFNEKPPKTQQMKE